MTGGHAEDMDDIGRARVKSPAAERILHAASELFYEQGIRAVGVDTIADRAGVTKATLYKNFGSKDELVAAYLRARDERWRAFLQQVTDGHADSVERLLAVFDAYSQDLIAEELRGCAFINATAEIADPNHPARAVAREHKEGVREHLAALAADSGFPDPQALAEQLLILLEGATVVAMTRRNPEPFDAARDVALRLLELKAPAAC